MQPNIGIIAVSQVVLEAFWNRWHLYTCGTALVTIITGYHHKNLGLRTTLLMQISLLTVFVTVFKWRIVIEMAPSLSKR